MATKRMIAQSIVDTDMFLEMPTSSRLLYYELNWRADDDGFVDRPKTIIKMVGCSEDDLKILLAKSYVLAFESGVIVIRHWRVHNYIRAERYHETPYVQEKALLVDEQGKPYEKVSKEIGMITSSVIPVVIPPVIPNGTNTNTNTKSNSNSSSTTNNIEENNNYTNSKILNEEINKWFEFKKERGQAYKEIGKQTLLKQINKQLKENGEEFVINCIEKSIENNWQGLFWKNFDNGKPQTSFKAFTDMLGRINIDE